MQETEPTTMPKPGFFYGYIIIIAIFFIMVFMFGTNFAFNVFFKPVQNEFGWTSAMTASAFSLCIIVQGLMGIVMGGLTDKFGPRLVMTTSGVLLGVGYLLMSQVTSIWQFYVFYGLVIGIGMSSAYVTLLSTTARWFNKRRNLMSGIVLVGMSVGSLVAPPVSERLISFYTWQTSYIITAIAVFVVVVLAAQFLKRDPSKVGQTCDGLKTETPSQANINNLGFTLKEAAGYKQFWLYVGAELCFGIILFALIVHIVNHAISLNFTPATGAIVFAAMAGFSIAGRLALGNAADRFGNKKIFLLGFILMAISLFLLAPATSLWALFVFAIIFGIAWGAAETCESPMTAWLFGLRSHGIVFGVISLTFTIGASLGSFMMGYIFDITGNYQLAFIILGVIGIIGFIFTFFLRSLVNNEKTP